MGKRKIYFAKRISINANPMEIVDVNPSMTPDEIRTLYIQKEIDRGKYIHNGHWILRAKFAENSLHTNSIPKDVTPYDIWGMVQQKIDSSNVLFAIVDSKAYGTIVEIGYASGKDKIAVYVLPDQNLKSEEIQDLWLVFQVALRTKKLWEQQDIENIAEFKDYHIYSIKGYLEFIEKIIPNFLK